MPLNLVVEGDAAETAELTGTYTLHKSCGTAKDSLYKKIGPNDAPIYLFLDPDPVGPIDKDTFVFANDCSRLQWGQPREIVGHLEPSFDPCRLGPGSSSTHLVTLPGSWRKETTITLSAFVPQRTIKMLPEAALAKISTEDCSKVPSIFEVQVGEKLNITDFSQYSWALENLDISPRFSQWQDVNLSPCTRLECRCSPTPPRIVWNVDKAGTATTHESRQAASLYERHMKLRGSAFQIVPHASPSETAISVGINIASLARRAKSKMDLLLKRGMQTNEVKYSWRLVPKQSVAGVEPFSKFKLRSTSECVPHDANSGLKRELHSAQKKSLEWMKAQENGVQIVLSETEEEIHPDLKWRVEARAETNVTVRGFVLADLPSFGKTITTIALIASDFFTKDIASLRDENIDVAQGETSTPPASSLTKLAATLIVCPPQITKQRRDELDNWLERSEEYKVLLLEKYSDLCKLSKKDFETAHVVIVSWTVLAEQEYIQQLASFSGMPLPATSKGRAFGTWLDYVSGHTPDQVQMFEKIPKEFKMLTGKLPQTRLESEEFNETLPLKLGHGSEYQSHESMQRSSVGKSKESSRRVGERSQSPLQRRPVLHYSLSTV